MKVKFLWISIIVIGISWIFNYTNYQSKQLDEPTFLKHYYEREIYDENELTFYYLTNKKDLSNINYVRIDGVDFYPQDGFWMMDNNIPHYEQEFRHHYLRSVTILFPKHSIPIDTGSNKEWSFAEMEVVFSNHPPITFNIGKVLFTPFTNREIILESRMSSSNNQHRNDAAFVALESVTIDSYAIPFPELSDDIEIKVNLNQEKLKELEGLRDGKEIPGWFNESMQSDWNNVKGISIKDNVFPLRLEKNDWMTIMTFSNPETKSFFRFSIKIKGKTTDGKTFTCQTYINEQPYLEQKDVDKIIEGVKGVKEL